MRTIAPALDAHLAAATTTLCLCVKIARQDGLVVGFTNHDKPFTFEGVLYQVVNAIELSAVVITSDLAVDNLELTGVIGMANEQEIDAGRWDGAIVNVFEVNWADFSMGANKQRYGIFGQVTVEANRFTAEVRGITQRLQTLVGETCSRFCKANLFDARCKMPETDGLWRFGSVPVTDVASYRRLHFAVLTQGDDFFTNGKIMGVAGDNSGITREIHAHWNDGGAWIDLFEDMPYTIRVDDTFTVWAGCQKRFTEDCTSKFGNSENFRGFPFLPGLDEQFAGP